VTKAPAYGYAVALDGAIQMHTVSPHARGAKLLGLLRLFNARAPESWTDADVDRTWRQAATQFLRDSPGRSLAVVPIRAEAAEPPKSLQDVRALEGMFRDMLAANPLDHFAALTVATMRLQDGDWREGPRLYEARLRDAGSVEWTPPQLPFPRWAGEPLDGRRVLIWPEQGFGDQIMFARFALALQARGCDVTLVCAAALESLFRANLPVRVRPATGSIEFPDPDVWIWCGSLMAALVQDEADIPGAPYLRSDGVTPVSFRVGLATRGNPMHENDLARSLPPELAAALLALPGCGSILPEDTGARDFAETAAIIAGLDLVIAVDTAIAHLAGAMGKPCWILLAASPTDWRWMRGRSDSPWYPSARLFRQPTVGDWASVVARVTTELQAARLSPAPR
jgi:hypothetical protein